MTLSTDYNTKTVVRATQAAQDYVSRGNASLAKRDVDRARSYLSKCPQDDILQLESDITRLEVAVLLAEQEQESKRIMIQLDRNIRYAKEALEKNDVNTVQRYVANARREIAKLPPADLREDQEAVLIEIEAQSALAEQRVKCASTIRQLEREVRSAKDVVSRANGCMSLENLEPYTNKLKTTIEKLPEALQNEWESKVEALVQEAAGLSTAREHKNNVLSTVDKKPTNSTKTPNSPGGQSVSTAATTSSSAPSSPVVEQTVSETLDPNIKRSIERLMRYGRENIDRNPDLAASYADQCHREIETKVPQQFQGELLVQVKNLQEAVTAAKQHLEVSRVLDACRRTFEACQALLDEAGSDIAVKIENRLEMLDRDIVEKDGNILSETDRDTLAAKYAELRETAKDALGNYHAKEARKLLNRYDEEITNGSNYVESYQRNAQEGLERVPNYHEDFAELKNTFDELYARHAAMTQAEKRDIILEDVKRIFHWLNSDTQGYENEVAGDLRNSGLGLDNTIKACERATEFLECEQLKGAVGTDLEKEVVGMVDAMKSTRIEALKKINSAALSLVKDADESDRPANLVSALQRMVDSLGRVSDPNDLLGDSLVAACTKIEAVQRKMSNAAADLEQKRNEANARAESLWSELVQGTRSYKSAALEQLDTHAVLENPTNYKGKLVVLEGKRNRMGWDFDIQSNDFMARIEGIPIVASFSPSVRDALQNMQQTIGFERVTQEFEGLAMEICGTGKAVPLRWNRALDKWDYLPTEDAVRLQIVAFRSGPFAVDTNGSRSI